MLFAVRRRVRSALAFLIVLGAFFVAGLIVLAVDVTAGIAMALFGGVFLLVVLMQALRVGWRYEVDPGGITVKRSLRSHRIPRERIAAVEAVEGERISQELAEAQWAEADAARSLDVAGGFRAQIEQGRFIGYSSVPITLSQARKGGPVSVSAVGSRAAGRFVLVTLEGGRKHALSPLDVEGFVGAYHDGGGA